MSEEALSATSDSKMITEVSSFQLETVSEFHAHIAAILNLSPDHLDRHKSFENYKAIKARISLNQDENDYLVYNADDAETQSCIEEIVRKREPGKAPSLVPFSLSRALPFEISEIEPPGKHNLENALAAAAICSCAGKIGRAHV